MIRRGWAICKVKMNACPHLWLQVSGKAKVCNLENGIWSRAREQEILWLQVPLRVSRPCTLASLSHTRTISSRHTLRLAQAQGLWQQAALTYSVTTVVVRPYVHKMM